MSFKSGRTRKLLQDTPSDPPEADRFKDPFEFRHGRRHLRSDLPYPLPRDLPELQRQSLRTLLGIQVFGAPICNPARRSNPPTKVLEVGCGTAYWSAMCHDCFAAQGYRDIDFYGLDIAPLAPNLRRQGMKWTFVQHDFRRTPTPFDDNQFDLIMFKDLSLAVQLDVNAENMLIDAIRILKPGGSIEVWEPDHVVRSLLNTQPPPPPKTAAEQEDARRTATFGLPLGHPFAQAQNKYLQTANKWIEECLDKRNLNATPSTRVADMLTQETELHDVGYRRVAIPFGELLWEKGTPNRRERVSNGHDSPMSVEFQDKDPMSMYASLTPDQVALRQTALMTMLGQIESLEPLLKDASGKNAAEWNQWWTSMMSDLSDPSRGGLVGECLEMGAWWATKAGDPMDDSENGGDEEVLVG